MSQAKITSASSSAAKFGAVGFLALALGCAAFAAYLVGDMMSARYAGTKVVPVVVATADLGAGTAIEATDFTVVEWPESAVPAGSFAAVEHVMDAHRGATLTVGVLAGEPIVTRRLAASTSGTGIAALLQPNMRGFALKVEDSVGFTGLVYPGAYVDVVATIRDPFGRGPSSRIAVQHARVLSVGMDSDVATRRMRSEEADSLSGKPQGGGTFVSLEVTPDEAEILSIAKAEGQVDIVLRNATDDAVVDTPGATPDRFSAFAVDPEVEGEPGEAAAAEPRTTPSRRLPRKKRRIQITASDEDDTPSSRSRGTIETYHAN